MERWQITVIPPPDGLAPVLAGLGHAGIDLAAVTAGPGRRSYVLSVDGPALTVAEILSELGCRISGLTAIGAAPAAGPPAPPATPPAAADLLGAPQERRARESA